jgi:hypothetical protein
MSATKLHYNRLTPVARSIIQNYGLTIVEYVRKAGGWTDGDWHGDRCGCSDDRCIGFHHDENDDCGCLPALIEQALGWTSPAIHAAKPGYPAFPNGTCTGTAYRGAGGRCRQCGWTP